MTRGYISDCGLMVVLVGAGVAFLGGVVMVCDGGFQPQLPYFKGY